VIDLSLPAWWDREVNTDFEAVESNVRRLLAEHGIRLRQDDGELVQINFSVPQSSQSALVLGLRYRKRDGTLTEDHFICRQQSDSLAIAAYYRASLEREFLEYVGTHKQQIELLSVPPALSRDSVATDPSTITFTRGLVTVPAVDAGGRPTSGCSGQQSNCCS